MGMFTTVHIIIEAERRLVAKEVGHTIRVVEFMDQHPTPTELQSRGI
jgi:hypothetical protein